MKYNMPLVEGLKEHLAKNRYRFHMPGHKGGNNLAPQIAELLGEKAFKADFTEIEGLDDLHNPQGVIGVAQELAAQCFGAEETFFLVNGATSGIEAALLATCKPGDIVIAPRNVHRSFLSGLILSGARPVYIEVNYSAQGLPLPLSSDQLREKIKDHPETKAAFVVSPTYEGLCINYEELIPVVKEAGVKLIVDEAHGAHFYFSPKFPKPALTSGADVVIHGSHKTIGSLTQTGMLHLADSRDRDGFQKALSMVQSTSPSYLLMASLDGARAHLALEGLELFNNLVELCTNARREINALSAFWCLSQEHLAGLAYDPTKLVIGSATGLTGFQLESVLSAYYIDMEMAALGYVLALVGVGDGEETLKYLVGVLKSIAKSNDLKHNQKQNGLIPYPPLPKALLSPREAYFSSTREVDLRDAEGQIAAEMIAPYPPGVPLICPGEVFTAEIVEYIKELYTKGVRWQGPADCTLQKVKIID
ncbi:MAG: aminotransferase class I/II-fold pyridoxal phosphate-dependent enzyme [Zhaonellaceae bacterium]